jgi:hypothetical protein
MATIAVLVSGYIAPGLIKTVFVSALGDADSTDPVRLYNIANASVEVKGTAAGATLIVEGSSDGVTYSALHDEDGTDLSFSNATVPRTENIRECNMPYIRVRTSGGSGTALIPTIFAQQEMM